MLSLRSFIFLISCVLLASCGSGGGSGGSNAGGNGTNAVVTPPPPVATVTTTLSATTQDFPNPERGFYHFAAVNDDFTQVDEPTLQDYADAGTRLVYAPVLLDSTVDSLSSASITALRDSFGRLRRTGMKAVLRFLYDATGTGQDAPLSRVLAHIGQLKPLLQENADVIAFWQAGFIGAWGEWHDSSNNLTADASKASIRDALLDALPAGRYLQVRDVSDIAAWYGPAATEADRLAGALKARVGMHNDCFLADPTDVYTYPGGLNDPLRDYAKAMTAVAPFGGETCGEISTPRMDCADILGEGAAYHLSYLNADYYTPFHTQWKSQGCYEQVSRSMGYRIELLGASHPAAAMRGAAFTLRLDLRNAGWARIYNPRDLVVTLRERSSGKEISGIAAGVDPRDWLPDPAGSYTVAATIAIPADAAAGAYDVLIGLPDPAPTLRTDARYAIRPANADDPAKAQAWDSGRGLFSLGTAVNVN